MYRSRLWTFVFVFWAATTTTLSLIAVADAAGVADDARSASASSSGGGGVRGFPFATATIALIETVLAGDRPAMTCESLVRGYLARIDAYDATLLNSIIFRNAAALDDARALDRVAASERGALHCVPTLVKDNINVAGMPTSGGCVTLADERVAGDALVVARLRAAGAVFLGKTNMAEFALDGGNTNSSLGGQTRNCYAPQRTPMGSSGGSGAAIGAGLAVIGLGTDTQGSIADPSNVASLFGLRSTQALLSLDGILPLYAAQDVVGPMCRSANDVARVMAVIDDGVTVSRPPWSRIYASARTGDSSHSLAGYRIGWLPGSVPGSPPVPPFLAADARVRAVLAASLPRWRQLGAEVVEVDAFFLDALVYASNNTRGSATCAPVGQRNGFNAYFANATAANAPVRSLDTLVDAYAADARHVPSVLATLQAAANASGTCSLGTRGCAEYEESRRVQALLAARTMASLRLDALLYATMDRLAPTLDAIAAGDAHTGLIASFLSSTSGQPSLTVPLDYVADGGDSVPVGATLLGRAFDEPTLVHIASVYENVFAPRQPPSCCPELSNDADRSDRSDDDVNHNDAQRVRVRVRRHEHHGDRRSDDAVAGL